MLRLSVFERSLLTLIAILLLAALWLTPMGWTRACLLAALPLAGVALWLSQRRQRRWQQLLTELGRNGAAPHLVGEDGLQALLLPLQQRLDAARRSRHHFDTVLASLADAVFLVGRDGTIHDSNAAAERLLGHEAAQLRGRLLSSLLVPESQETFDLTRAAAESRDYILATASGAVLPVAITGARIASSEEIIFVVHDVTDRRRAERRVSFLAKHDSLTGVPNRMQFQHLLQQALARAQRDQRTLAILYLDVDRFKDVNDSFGHAAGDRALTVLCERLTRLLPPGAVIGRLAGDEFAIFLTDVSTELQATLARFARELLGDISRAFLLEETEIYLTVSIGIALARAPIDNTVELIRAADLAMYQAKQSGGGTYAFYDPAVSAAAAQRLILRNKLRRSIERHELVVLYQPLVDLASGRTIGAEALLRWRLPGHGDIPPAVFIPLAEQSDLIHAIGDFVLRQVCTDYSIWRAAGVAPQRLAINLSLRQFGREGLVQQIADLLTEHRIERDVIELEITESTLMEYTHSAPKLAALRALGVRLALDDFGTGYSSLATLRELPLHTLKIDQSFLRHATGAAGDRTLVHTIIDLGRHLGLEVVAEGVESDSERQLLVELGCPLAQGRLFGTAMSAAELPVRWGVPVTPAQRLPA